MTAKLNGKTKLGALGYKEWDLMKSSAYSLENSSTSLLIPSVAVVL